MSRGLELLGTKDQPEASIVNMTTVVIVAAAIHLLARSGIATNVVALVVVVNVTVSGEMENGVESLVTANGPLGIVTDVIMKISPRMDAERVSHHSFDFHLS